MAPAALEKKRKLPARAAARVEQAAKKRHVASRERSPSPAPVQPVKKEPTPPPPPPPRPSLPTSIQVGKPLPTIENAQPEDLSTKEFQSVSESGVLAESLSRSRQKWINDGLFEKYWTKPYKRKGVLHEDPKNPPKDSMTRIGNVTIIIEPHIVEATMFAVKASKLPSQQSGNNQQTPGRQPTTQTKAALKQPPPPTPTRPIIQYGPPNGSMPPPPTPTPTPAEATPAHPAVTPKPPTPQSPAGNSSKQIPAPTSRQQEPGARLADPSKAASPAIVATNSVSSTASPVLTPRPQVANSPVLSTTSALSTTPGRQQTSTPSRQVATPSRATPQLTAPAGRPQPSVVQAPGSAASHRPSPGPAPAAANTAPKPAANDPVIALLAQRASGDPELRDLMKRVAVGQAREGELARFQKIIDQLNIECRQRNNQPGPSADKLLVDGRTVKYFADEVKTILDIVLASNPNQKSTELRPPAGSDALVVLLVKTALEDQRTKDIIRRIAEGRPGATDAQDLKEILDRLHRDAKTVPKGPPPAQSQPKQSTPNGVSNSHGKAASTPAQQGNAQALRSKGPAPAARPDISAVVFDFGSGDRYLFPKYSILEFLPTKSGQQVIASFLIVRKGSISEYGGDPNLDYYQPITIRLSTNSGRHLENLARVVAPQDEVRRYMDNVMDNMTRAEYVLLAMQLPRPDYDGDRNVSPVEEESRTGNSTPKVKSEPEKKRKSKSGVLWACTRDDKLAKPAELAWEDEELPERRNERGETQYETLLRLIREHDEREEARQRLAQTNGANRA
ncbi:hypothetical protein HIM_02193 [Hirsutella minnesotensis 3608]|nr:hypothetical protein HIM_02193 [Hirsutella minnesotensis 3608]